MNTTIRPSRAHPASRGAQLRLIYRWTHRDYKTSTARVCSIMLMRAGKTMLVQLDDLTDAEIAERLPYAIKKQIDFEARTAPAIRTPPKESA